MPGKTYLVENQRARECVVAAQKEELSEPHIPTVSPYVESAPRRGAPLNLKPFVMDSETTHAAK